MLLFEDLVYEKPADLFSGDQHIAITDSRLLAEQLGKDHYDLLKSIRKVLEFEPELAEGNISFCSYRDPNNRDRDQYELDEEGAYAVVMETSGSRARACRVKIRKAFFAFRNYFEEDQKHGFVTVETKKKARASNEEMKAFLESVVKKEIQPLRKEVALLYESIAEIAVPRKEFTAKYKKNAAHCCLERRSGKCPICESVVIVEQSGQWNDKCNFDHIDNDRSNATQFNCMPVCIDCHRKKRQIELYYTQAGVWVISLKDYVEPGNQMEFFNVN